MRTSARDLRNVVALSLVKNMGPVSYKKLVEAFGTMESVLASAEKEFARKKGSSRVLWADLKDPGLLSRADEEIKKAAALGIDIIPVFDERYPSVLREIHDPPIILYVKGTLPAEETIKVAVVGSRVSSMYGRRMATQISRDLASAGAAVVSGLALGIDTAAHEGALAADGITLAVLGGGIGHLYPKENRKLADKICQKGALISEYPVDMKPDPQHFPVRNRIISGLSSAVLVVEAKEKSGALITADQALEQGREVFALPGNADSSKSLGTNSLLKQGARLALSAADVLSELGYTITKKAAVSRRASLSAEEQKVVSILDAGPVQLEEIVEASGISLQKTITVLSYLEMKGFVKETPGKIFQKA